MGSYSEFYVKDYPVFSAKNNYYHNIAELIFLPSDYIEYQIPLKDKNSIVWGEQFLNNDAFEIVKSFKSNTKICKERLELFGANYDTAKLDFEKTLKKLIEDEAITLSNSNDINFEFYLETIQEIINTKEKNYENDYYIDFKGYLIQNGLLLENQNISLGLWSMLNVVELDCTVEYDLTEVINGGWIDENIKNEINIQKIIVLTEGKTDTEFIKAGLNLFYPHLENYYHFMDFENSKYEANASRLVHTIKSFVGSGINNLIIALFDNDAAALKEINNLKKVKLPNNIKVLQYPDIELAKNYPTIGPTGNQHMDVNGLACSIEMYLGIDCITENNEFLKIQWTGLVENIDKYQGVILKKEEVQKRFRQKVKNFNPNLIELDNWKELHLIINMMNNCWKT